MLLHRIILTTLALTVCMAQANALQIRSEVPLGGGAEVPPNQSSADGTAIVSFFVPDEIAADDDLAVARIHQPAIPTIDIEATITGIFLADITFPDQHPLSFGQAGPFHIHQGAAGATGPVVVAFNNPDWYTETNTGLFIQAFDVEFDPAILNGPLYLNLHTLEYPSGELRGQIRIAEPTTLLLLGLGLIGFATASRKRK